MFWKNSRTVIKKSCFTIFENKKLRFTNVVIKSAFNIFYCKKEFLS